MVTAPHAAEGMKQRGMAGKRIAAVFGLEKEGGWERHANPVSVWTRFAALPLLVVAIWSREWIGWWSLVPIALSVIWMGINPLFFKPPRSTRNWASQSVFGERIFVQRDKVSIPQQYATRVPQLIQVFQSIGLIPLVYGLFELDLTATVLGLLIVQCAKLWYLDRMMLLFNDMKSRPEYASWDYDRDA
jgi:hypothetical protein